MYIPKNRIKTNLYTPGDEFMIKGTDQIYSGFYHSLWTGKYFTGKTQNELPKSELVPIAPQSGLGTPDLPPALETTNTIALFLNDPDPVVNEDQWNQGDIVTYLKLTGQSTTDDKPREMPYQCYPKPTEDDYALGVFTRYFSVKVNEDQYLELTKELYDFLNKQNADYVWELYNVFNLQWTLTGNRDEVIISNRNQTLIAQQRLKRKGLSSFLQLDWSKFYKTDLE